MPKQEFSIATLANLIPDEASAYKLLEDLRWKGSRRSARCATRTAGAFNLQLPLVGNAKVSIGGPGRLTEDAWDQLMRFLEVMKPSIVQPPE